jgi:hypothetical protein
MIPSSSVNPQNVKGFLLNVNGRSVNGKEIRAIPPNGRSSLSPSTPISLNRSMYFSVLARFVSPRSSTNMRGVTTCLASRLPTGRPRALLATSLALRSRFSARAALPPRVIAPAPKVKYDNGSSAISAPNPPKKLSMVSCLPTKPYPRMRSRPVKRLWWVNGEASWSNGFCGVGPPGSHDSVSRTIDPGRSRKFPTVARPLMAVPPARSSNPGGASSTISD